MTDRPSETMEDALATPVVARRMMPTTMTTSPLAVVSGSNQNATTRTSIQAKERLVRLLVLTRRGSLIAALPPSPSQKPGLFILAGSLGALLLVTPSLAFPRSLSHHFPRRKNRNLPKSRLYVKDVRLYSSFIANYKQVKRTEKREIPVLRAPEPAGDVVPSDDDDEDSIEEYL